MLSRAVARLLLGLARRVNSARKQDAVVVNDNTQKLLHTRHLTVWVDIQSADMPQTVSFSLLRLGAML